MSSAVSRFGRSLIVRAFHSALLLVLLASTARAQFVRQAVGGISIDTKGVLVNAERDHNGLRQFWLDMLKPVPEQLNQQANIRKISAAWIGGVAGRNERPGGLARRGAFSGRTAAGGIRARLSAT